MDAHPLYFPLGVDDLGLANVELLRHLLLNGSLLTPVGFKVFFGLLERPYEGRNRRLRFSGYKHKETPKACQEKI